MACRVVKGPIFCCFLFRRRRPRSVCQFLTRNRMRHGDLCLAHSVPALYRTEQTIPRGTPALDGSATQITYMYYTIVEIGMEAIYTARGHTLECGWLHCHVMHARYGSMRGVSCVPILPTLCSPHFSRVIDIRRTCLLRPRSRARRPRSPLPLGQPEAST